MSKIFISHSRYDKEIRNYFDEIFAGTTVKAIRLEFEDFKEPPSKFILKSIRDSDAIFVLLGPNITRSPATPIWVGFETGVGASKEAVCPIWVFEPIQHAPIQFPVPFLHHYVPYDSISSEHRKYITSIVKGYQPPIPLFRMFTIPKGWKRVTCQHKGCGMSYILHTPIDEIYCPTCRQRITF